jgi:hypothetical protein
MGNRRGKRINGRAEEGQKTLELRKIGAAGVETEIKQIE